MVGTATELPRAQMQGPVGLQGERGSDARAQAHPLPGRLSPRPGQRSRGRKEGDPRPTAEHPCILLSPTKVPWEPLPNSA